MIASQEYYLSDQLITYIGNKRKLLPQIEEKVKQVQKELDKEKLICADLFSGSGVVSRLLMGYASDLYAIDQEAYAKCINDCYLYTNKTLSPEILYTIYRKLSDRLHRANILEGFFTENYSESLDGIKPTDRLFYTWENGTFLDTFKYWLKDLVKNCSKDYSKWLYNFFMAPILSEASVHVNTCGIFKGFYKGKDGIGKFGGENENCLERIKGRMSFMFPVISEHWQEVSTSASQEDCNEFAQRSKYTPGQIDFTYIDPPYNQHPYGSNYFMLNMLADKEESYKNFGKEHFSKVSGIPKDWNRSDYNVQAKAKQSLKELIEDINTKYLLLSYSSDGFISYDEVMEILKNKGDVEVTAIDYQSFRGSRNFDKDKKVTEYLFLVHTY